MRSSMEVPSSTSLISKAGLSRSPTCTYTTDFSPVHRTALLGMVKDFWFPFAWDSRRAVTNISGFNKSSGLRSEEHTSELQSRENLVCRLLLEKKKPHTRVHSLEHPLTRR